ncbi:MAG: HK97 gp10 family phage protein [Patescibacteria group bacterium]|nr:HK97 gp10 family phage protein [Patescibacteria group bacterium]
MTRDMQKNLSSGLQTAGRIMERALKKRLQRGGTLHIKGRSPYPDLRSRTGTLRRSIAVNPQSGAKKVSNGYQVRVGPNIVYARIHEFGGMTGRNYATRIPARPYLMPTFKDEKKNITDAIIKKLVEPLK